MAYVDSLLEFSNNQSIVGSSPVVGANVVDLTTARDVGGGKSVPVTFQVASGFSGLVSLECQVIQADDPNLSANVEQLGSTGAIEAARLTAGAAFAVSVIPLINRKARRYWGVRYVPIGSASTGSISARIGGATNGARVYGPAGFSVI